VTVGVDAIKGYVNDLTDSNDDTYESPDQVWGDRLEFFMPLSLPHNIIAWSKMRLYLLKVMEVDLQVRRRLLCMRVCVYVHSSTRVM
jgi:hypothetical protein